MTVTRFGPLVRGFLLGTALAMVSTAALAQNRTFSFAYDQPKNSGYGEGAEIFNDKLKELSKGTLSINEYPSAQLGTEAQTLQKLQTGDIDFVFLSTANASTAQPESGRVLDPLHLPRRERTRSKCSAIPASSRRCANSTPPR